jgi:formylglycine-generating enzyme required for sulfatase activity
MDASTTTNDGVTASTGSTASEGMTMGPPGECGNGEAEAEEACDGMDLQGATCESLGFGDGVVACMSCSLDASGCEPPLGMVLVPSGVFDMGSSTSSNEAPARRVTVDGFWIDATEVTVAQYSECLDEGLCDAPPVGPRFNYEVAGREGHPINGVNWYDADVYCGWVDGGVKRLPTEAEWEKAARGTDAFAYPWGNAVASCTRAVMVDALGVDGCGTGSTGAVGEKLLGVSQYGVLDMAGNVQEWVSDWYGDYHPLETDNPTGPAEGVYRVLRGGAWDDDDPGDLRTARRNLDNPADHTDTVGFRCVRPTRVGGP